MQLLVRNRHPRLRCVIWIWIFYAWLYSVKHQA